MKNKLLSFILLTFTVFYSCQKDHSKHGSSNNNLVDAQMNGLKTRVLLNTLSASGVSLSIYGHKSNALDTLEIIPMGFEIINDTIDLAIDGQLTASFTGDINQDNYPEFYLVATSVGSGSYGTLYAYGSYRNKSMGPIYCRPLDSALMKGYMGHDQYLLENNKLIRKFPLYRQNDTNAQPTGGDRQIIYELTHGEASMILTGKLYEQ